jgi:hypothetical protein
MVCESTSERGLGGHQILSGSQQFAVRSAWLMAIVALGASTLTGCASHAQETTSDVAPHAAFTDTHGIAHRVHQVAGLKVVEVVVGDVPFDSDLPIVMQIHGRGDQVRIPSAPRDRDRPVRLLLPEAPDR